MAKSSAERKRNYAHIRYMKQDIGLDDADILAYAGHKYESDNGGLESLRDLTDDQLDDLINSLRAYLDIQKIVILNPDKALKLAKNIVQIYSQSPENEPSDD